VEKVKRGRPDVLYDGSGTSGDPTVISFDPGGVTGWAVSSVHPVAVRKAKYAIMDNVSHFACGQFVGTEFDQVDAMLELCKRWPGAAVVTEKFILLNPSSSEMLLSPVRLNAAMRYALGRNRRVHNQMPALAKTTITDARLKDMGYYERTIGMEHARDAVRHNLTFWRRIKTQYPLRKLVFPALA
jgi:hypothetical protein